MNTVNSATTLGLALRDQRKSMNLSQMQLSELCRVDQATISAVERGAETTQLKTLLRMMASLNLNISLVSRSAIANDSEVLW